MKLALQGLADGILILFDLVAGLNSYARMI